MMREQFYNHGEHRLGKDNCAPHQCSELLLSQLIKRHLGLGLDITIPVFVLACVPIRLLFDRDIHQTWKRTFFLNLSKV